MQGLDEKEWKVLLQITQCTNPKGGVDVQHSQKYNKIITKVHKIESAPMREQLLGKVWM